MNEVAKREPVDNSHRDAGIAAREASKAAEKATPEAEAIEQGQAEEQEEAEGEAEQVETQNETEESADSDQGDAKPKPKNRGVGKRIDELTKEKYDAQRERDYWREMAMKGQPQGQHPEPQPAQAAEKDTGEPTLESCDFDMTEFTRRHYQWARSQEQQQEAAAARQRTFVEKETAFRAEHPDYDAIARNPSLPITKAMADVIVETDNPPAVAYYLGQNPNEAAAIAQMPERSMSRAIGRIEAKLSVPPPAPETPRQPEPKTVTRAPAPVTTLSGSPVVKKTYEGMSMKEYDEERRKERAAKGLSNR